MSTIYWQATDRHGHVTAGTSPTGARTPAGRARALVHAANLLWQRPDFQTVQVSFEPFTSEGRPVQPTVTPTRQLTCGCCTQGCVCWLHQDRPRGLSARVCLQHQESRP